MKEAERQHTRRHTARVRVQPRHASQVFQQACARFLAVQQQRGVLAASACIGRQQCLDFCALLCRARVGIGNGTGRAHGGASTAADAQVRVYFDLLATFFAADGRGRTHINAGIAAHGVVAAVGAQLLLVIEELGLFKLAHQRAHLQQRAAVLAIPAKITLRQGVLRERRRSAQVQHQVKLFAQGFRFAAKVNRARNTANLDAGPVGLAQAAIDLIIKANRAFRTRRQAGIAPGTQVQVNRVAARPVQLESPQPAGQLPDFPGQHRVAPFLRAAALPCTQTEQGHIQRIRQQLGSALGGIEFTNDEQTPGTFVGDGRHGLGIGQVRHGQQGGNFRTGTGRVLAPAAGFANIDELDHRSRPVGLLRQFGKQPLFLGASDHHVFARLNGFLESAGFAPAQHRMQRQVFVKCRAQRTGLERHGLVAVANESGHGRVGWRQSQEKARAGWNNLR